MTTRVAPTGASPASAPSPPSAWPGGPVYGAARRLTAGRARRGLLALPMDLTGDASSGRGGARLEARAASTCSSSAGYGSHGASRTSRSTTPPPGRGQRRSAGGDQPSSDQRDVLGRSRRPVDERHGLPVGVATTHESPWRASATARQESPLGVDVELVERGRQRPMARDRRRAARGSGERRTPTACAVRESRLAAGGAPQSSPDVVARAIASVGARRRPRRHRRGAKPVTAARRAATARAFDFAAPVDGLTRAQGDGKRRSPQTPSGSAAMSRRHWAPGKLMGDALVGLGAGVGDVGAGRRTASTRPPAVTRSRRRSRARCRRG